MISSQCKHYEAAAWAQMDLDNEVDSDDDDEDAVDPDFPVYRYRESINQTFGCMPKIKLLLVLPSNEKYSPK
jgi:hypothetical protein